MAKLTFDEFKSILDYIEQRQPDSYSSLYLYVKEYTEKATVFKHPITDEEVRSVVDAIVIQESVQLVDSEHIYKLPVIRDASWVGSGSKPKDAVNVYDRFIAGYTNAEDIMNTICRAYGVILSELFKYEAPDDYNKILRLIAGFYNNAEDVRNQPFGAKKYGEEYLSYFPVYIVYEVGKYLSDLGVFEKLELNYQPYIRYDVPCTDVPTFTEAQFRANVLSKAVSLNNESMGTHLTGCFNLVSSLLDFNKIILCLFNDGNLTVFEFPKNVKFHYRYGGSNFRFITPYRAASGYNYSTNIYISFDETSSYTKYSVRYDFNTQVYSYSKSTLEISDTNIHTEYANAIAFCYLNNINYLSLPIYYMYNYSTWADGGNNYKPYFSLGTISGARVGYQTYFYGDLTGCIVSDVQKLNSDDFRKITILANKELDMLFNEYDIEFSSDDLVLAYSDVPTTPVSNNINYTKIFILRDLNIIDSHVDSSVTDVYSIPIGINWSSFISLKKNKYSVIDSSVVQDIYLNQSAEKVCWRINSSTPFNVDEYEIHPDGTFSRQLIRNVQSYIPVLNKDYLAYNRYQYKLSNIGKIVTPKEKPDWYDLESDAVLPDAISTIQDLTATYPDWLAKSVRIHTPYYEGSLNEEVLTGLTTVDFVPLSVSGADSQSEAQAGIIDVDNFDIILEQIEDAEEDINPEEDPDVDPNDDPPNTNIGDTPDVPDLDDLPNLANIGLLHMYQMSEGQLRTFANVLLDPLSTVEKFFNNPFDAIISLQASPIFNASGVSTDLIFNGFTFAGCQGQLIINNNVDGDFGEVDLSPYFNNYIDYTDTEIELYLPFVGYVSIDVDKFINGKIHLKCRVDNLTGSIVYFVYSIRDGATQLLYTFDGNCQSQVPVTSSDYSRLFAGLFGMATGAIAGAANVANYIDPVNTMARHVARKNLEYEMSPNIVELNMRERAVRDMQRGVDLVNNPIAKQLFGGD